MKLNFNTFNSENLLMSVMGHLVVLALMITSFALVVHRATLVAPDRIQIYEIDLNSVRVSGDETILYNVNADSAPEQPTPVPEQKPEPAPTPPQKRTPRIQTIPLPHGKKQLFVSIARLYPWIAR